MSVRRRRVETPAAVPCVPVTVSAGDAVPDGVALGRSAADCPAFVRVPGDSAPTTPWAHRMARFVTGARRVVTGALATGALIAVSWLLAMFFGLLGAAPAAADSTAATGSAPTDSGPSAASPAATTPGDAHRARDRARGHDRAHRPARGLANHLRDAAASDIAAAMAGRGVDGLTSQSEPVLPARSTADHGSGADGFVPQGGGGPGQFGPGVGDLARSTFDPRVMVLRAPWAWVLPPVVRTAADEPSFSPD